MSDKIYVDEVEVNVLLPTISAWISWGDKMFARDIGARSAITVVFGAVLLVLLQGPIVHAGPIVDLPIIGDFTHFDLNAGTGATVLDPVPTVPAVPTPVIGGPCGAGIASIGCAFGDGLASDSPLLWQTELNNANAFPIIFNVGFFLPGASVVGTLGLAAGDSALFTVAVDDSSFETANWFWFVANGLANTVTLIDVAVSENFAGLPGVSNGDFNFLSGPSPDSFFFESPTDTPNFVISAVEIPLPPTGLLLLLGYGVLGSVRRSSHWQGR